MELDVSLSFCPQQASIHLGLDGDGTKRRTISLVTELASNCDVITADERSMRSSAWTVQLLDKDSFNEHVKKEQAIGLLSHSPEYTSASDYLPEACFVSVAVDPTTFQTVYDTLRTGRLPSFISVSVRGMTYGWDPDGGTKIWDTDTARNLYITDVSITTPLVSVEPEASEEDFETPVHLATSADANAIRQEVTTAIVQMQNKVIAQTRWLVGIGVGVLILWTTHFK
jgi:hypothetical protein